MTTTYELLSCANMRYENIIRKLTISRRNTYNNNMYIIYFACWLHFAASQLIVSSCVVIDNNIIVSEGGVTMMSHCRQKHFSWFVYYIDSDILQNTILLFLTPPELLSINKTWKYMRHTQSMCIIYLYVYRYFIYIYMYLYNFFSTFTPHFLPPPWHATDINIYETLSITKFRRWNRPLLCSVQLRSRCVYLYNILLSFPRRDSARLVTVVVDARGKFTE